MYYPTRLILLLLHALAYLVFLGPPLGVSVASASLTLHPSGFMLSPSPLLVSRDNLTFLNQVGADPNIYLNDLKICVADSLKSLAKLRSSLAVPDPIGSVNDPSKYTPDLNNLLSCLVTIADTFANLLKAGNLEPLKSPIQDATRAAQGILSGVQDLRNSIPVAQSGTLEGAFPLVTLIQKSIETILQSLGLGL